MRQWKQAPSSVAFRNWNEVAGFVDAEACFEAISGSSIRLIFHQKHSVSLDGLQRFFLEKLGIKARVRIGAKDTHRLAVGHKSTQKICPHLLEGGLLLKRTQAELALSRTSTNGLVVRTKLQELKGNQGQFRRQDNEGIARALEIHRLQKQRSQLNCSSRGGLPELDSQKAGKLAELTAKIDLLKLEHQRKELEREVIAMLAALEEMGMLPEAIIRSTCYQV